MLSVRPDRPSYVLFGNMVDLEEEGRREVQREEGEAFAEEMGCKYVEVSARGGGQGLDQGFGMLVRERLGEMEVRERQAEIEKIMREHEEEERRREEEEKERIRAREEALMESLKTTTEEREKEQNDLIAEEMRQREAMKQAALANMRF